MIITKIDRYYAKIIRERTLTALIAVADEFGMSVTINGGSFNSEAGTYRPKVEFALGNAEDAARRKFEAEAPLVGLGPEHYGVEFIYAAKRWKLIGINTRAPKYPLLAERLDASHKRFRLGEGAIPRIKEGAQA